MTGEHDHEPLRQTFERVAALSSYINARVGLPSEEGWISPETLFTPDSALLAGLIEHQQQHLRTTSANVVGSALLQGYQWLIIGAALGAYLVDRRVPDLALDAVRVRFSEAGSAAAIAFTRARFAALPSDPAAHHPDAYVVPDLDALRERLRTGLETHLGWVINRIGEITGCRRAGLWLAAADRCASTVSWLMQLQDAQAGLHKITAEMEPLVRVPSSPLANKKATLIEVTHLEQSHVFCERATCCFWYKSDGGDFCSTCPRLSRTERYERLRQALVAGQA